jgi:hypothetical protein
MTSELRTKKGSLFLASVFSASLSGPAVPRGSVSIENVILTLYCSSYCRENRQSAGCVGQEEEEVFQDGRRTSARYFSMTSGR